MANGGEVCSGQLVLDCCGRNYCGNMQYNKIVCVRAGLLVHPKKMYNWSKVLLVRTITCGYCFTEPCCIWRLMMAAYTHHFRTHIACVCKNFINLILCHLVFALQLHRKMYDSVCTFVHIYVCISNNELTCLSVSVYMYCWSGLNSMSLSKGLPPSLTVTFS